MKLLFFLAALAVLVYFGFRWFERAVLFHPTRAWEVLPSWVEGPAEEFYFSAGDGTRLSGLWLASESPRAVIVFAHGNAGNLSHRIPLAAAWRSHLQVSMLLFDYRGYGRSEGTPTEPGLSDDMEAAYKEAEKRGGQTPIIAGRSLGTVPAVKLAAAGSGRGLILDSPIASAAEMARRIIPLPGIERLLSFKLDNLSRIVQVRCPVLVIHGQNDEIVPLEQGMRVYNAATGTKQIFVMEGWGHNDDRTHPQLLSRLSQFIESLEGAD